VHCKGVGVCPHQRRRRACRACAAAASGASSHSALRFDMAALPYDPALALTWHPGQGVRAACRARARTASRRRHRWLPGGATGGSPAAPQVAPVKHETKNLLLARADVHLTNLYGRTALHYAAMERIVSACRALVDAGALPDELDHHGFIAVQHSVLMKRADWDHVTTS
jgi:hypothetical protein